MCRPQEDHRQECDTLCAKIHGREWGAILQGNQPGAGKLAGFSQLCASLGCSTVIRLAAGDHVPAHEIAAKLAAMPALDISVTDGDRFVLVAVADELVYPRPSKIAAATTISAKATQDASSHV